MPEIQIRDDVRATEAFAAVAEVSLLLGAYPDEPEDPEALKVRYEAVYPHRASRGRLHQSQRSIDTFIEQFDAFQQATGVPDGASIGRLVCADGSVVEAVVEHHHKRIDTDCESWGFLYRGLALYIKQTEAQPVDDVLVRTCYRDSFFGRYVQENVFTGLAEQFEDYLRRCSFERKYKHQLLDKPSYDNFRRYLGSSFPDRDAERKVWFPNGARYSSQLFDFVARLPEVAALAPDR